MSRKQPSSSREPKRQLGTAAPKKHTCVRSFASVPAAIGGDLDRSIRSALADRTGLSRMHRDLDLQQRYGISVGAIRRYAKQLRAAGSLPADGSEVRTLAKRSPTAMPMTQRFQDTLSGHLFNALQRQLQDPDLPPEQLENLKMMDFSSPTPRPRPRATPPAPKGGTIADPHQAPPGPAAAPNP